MGGQLRRWLPRALWLATGVVVLAVFVVLWRTSTVWPAHLLRRDLEARGTARFARPPHVQPPGPGTFGAQAGEAWDALALLEAGSADVELCRAVREGEQPQTALSASCRREGAAAAGALDRLLRATHAAEAGPPPGLGTLDVPTPEGRPRGWSTLPYAGKLGALRLRQLFSEGDLAGAVQVCVDLQALARDASWGTGLAGRLPALAVEEVSFRPCVAALDVAPTAVKRTVEVELGRVEEGTPSYSDVVAEYALGVRAQAFGQYLGIARWAQEGGPPRRMDWRSTLELGDAWHRIDARLAEAVKAAALPMPGRADRLDLLASGERPLLNPRAAYALPQLGRAARSDARARSQLHLLRGVVAADLLRTERGRWPSAEELAAALGDGSGPRLRVEPNGPLLTLVDPSVPRGELVVTIRPDP